MCTHCPNGGESARTAETETIYIRLEKSLISIWNENVWHCSYKTGIVSSVAFHQAATVRPLLLLLLLPGDGTNIIFKCDSQIPYTEWKRNRFVAREREKMSEWSASCVEIVWFVDRLLQDRSCRRPLEATSNKIARWRALLASSS